MNNDKEQQEQWSNLTGPGLYKAEGPRAYTHVAHRIVNKVINPGDPHTVLLIGKEKDTVKFLERMTNLEVIDGPAFCEPKFFWFEDSARDEDGIVYERNLNSELDAERFRNFIATSVEKRYFPIAAVVILDDGQFEGKLKHLDRILEVPVMKGKYRDKVIRPEIYQVFTYEWDESSFTKVSSDPRNAVVKRSIELVRGDEVQPEHIEWMVPEFLPAHQPNAFTGEMDTRKSTLALDIAAVGSTFGEWFMGGERNQKPFITLVAASEDTFSTTVLPRYIAAGGVRDCLYSVKLDVQSEQQTNEGLKVYSTPFSFDEHLNLLHEAIVKINSTREWPVGLLINDPIISLFGAKNYNNPQDARDVMLGQKRLCEELQLTIINICHFNKTLGLTAKQKTAGSKALIEAHRQAWAFDLMEEDKSITLIAPVKHNLLKDARSYKITTVGKDIEWPVGDGYYQKANVGKIRFVGYSEMSADDRIEERESKDRGDRKAVKEAILDCLKGGPMPAGQVKNQLRDMTSIPTIERAAKSLETAGKLRRSGTNRNNIVWQLASEPQQATFDKEVVRDEQQ